MHFCVWGIIDLRTLYEGMFFYPHFSAASDWPGVGFARVIWSNVDEGRESEVKTSSAQITRGEMLHAGLRLNDP